MDNKLTSQKAEQTTKKTDYYDDMVNNRTRPELPKQKELKEVTSEEAYEAATAYFDGDTLAASVWMNKYALKDSEGKLYEKTPDEMHHRIAGEIARIENKYPDPLTEKEIYETLKRFKYIVPQGSPMAGIGNPFQISSLSNCFVVGNREGSSDSYGGILKIDQEQVQLMKRRGGVGHDLSNIRPAGSPVKNSALTSTGVVPFMERYSNSTREVAQDGRRGALMLTISIKHPDAESFIDAKMEKGKVTGANVSVKVDNAFMQAVVNNTTYIQQYPVNSDNPSMVKEIDARKLWKKIIHNAWASAEPGVIFWDTLIDESVPDSYGEDGFNTVSTNPCGEIPLCPYDSCRLLAINLFGYVQNAFTDEAYFDFDLFKKHVAVAQRMMDDIIDLEIEKVDGILEKIDNDPEDEETKWIERRMWQKIKEKTRQGRRTGIGITAEGDMLAALGLTYGNDEAREFSVEVHKTLTVEAYRSSVNLAKDRGSFPVFDFKKEQENPFIKRIATVDPQMIEEMKQYGRRNIALLTIAPTGSVSICTQTTSGIEPAFQISYTRKRKVNPNDRNISNATKDELGDYWEKYNVFHHSFLTWLRENGYNVEEVRQYSREKLEEVIAQSPYYKATSNDINWVSKVKMQGAVQKWVDHSISVTVNLPNHVSEELVSEVYETAWKSGCKGMTIYRDGSRSGVLVNEDDKSPDQDGSRFRETHAPKRPKILEADVVRFQNAYEKWVAVVGLLDDKPYEIFTGRADDFYLPQWVESGWVIKQRLEDESSRYDFKFQDKQGYNITVEGLSRSFNKEYWNYAKLISGVLRHGMPIKHAIHLIDNLNLKGETLNTWKNGVVRALKRYIPNGEKAEKTCPSCQMEGTLEYKEGCLTCSNCGFSECS